MGHQGYETGPGLLLGLLFLSLPIVNPVAAEAQATGICPAQLGEALDGVANRSDLSRARWGILVQTLGTGETLYERDAERYFTPASNVKLLTTAAALEQLGPQFQIRTSVYRVAAAEPTVLQVVGRGDPSLTTTQLTSLAQQLRQHGITQVDRLLVDDHYFRGEFTHPDWEWEDVQAGYGAPVNSLILNLNAIALTLAPQAIGQLLQVVWDNPADAQGWQLDNQSNTVAATEPEFVDVGHVLSRPLLQIRGQLRIGSEPESVAIAVSDPTQRFLNQFQQILATKQITVVQTAIAPRPLTGNNPEVATVLSPPLAELLIPTNQDSENLYAESLLRLLGVTSLPAPAQSDISSLDAGIAAVETILARLGVDPAGYDLVDGSGLARQNLASPAALVQTLQGMARSPYAAIFRNSLAVAGTSGTLRHRFRNTPIQGRLQGKTGALSGVATLSGYLTPPNHPPLVFSILLNQFDQPVRTVRPAIDEMVTILGQLQECRD